MRRLPAGAFCGKGTWVRTKDLLVKSQLLFRLSYTLTCLSIVAGVLGSDTMSPARNHSASSFASRALIVFYYSFGCGRENRTFSQLAYETSVTPCEAAIVNGCAGRIRTSSFGL